MKRKRIPDSQDLLKDGTTFDEIIFSKFYGDFLISFMLDNFDIQEVKIFEILCRWFRDIFLVSQFWKKQCIRDWSTLEEIHYTIESDHEYWKKYYFERKSIEKDNLQRTIVEDSGLKRNINCFRWKKNPKDNSLRTTQGLKDINGIQEEIETWCINGSKFTYPLSGFLNSYDTFQNNNSEISLYKDIKIKIVSDLPLPTTEETIKFEPTNLTTDLLLHTEIKFLQKFRNFLGTLASSIYIEYFERNIEKKYESRKNTDNTDTLKETIGAQICIYFKNGIMRRYYFKSDCKSKLYPGLYDEKGNIVEDTKLSIKIGFKERKELISKYLSSKEVFDFVSKNPKGFQNSRIKTDSRGLKKNEILNLNHEINFGQKIKQDFIFNNNNSTKNENIDPEILKNQLNSIYNDFIEISELNLKKWFLKNQKLTPKLKLKINLLLFEFFLICFCPSGSNIVLKNTEKLISQSLDIIH